MEKTKHRNGFKTITSLHNPQINILKKLALKKYRSEKLKFTIENLSIISDALNKGNDFESLYVSESFVSKHKERMDSLMALSKSSDFFLINEKINKYYSQLDSPSGITAVYKTKVKNLNKTSVIYLDSISDPGNLGTIMRNALAFGFKNLVLGRNCADIYNFKTINASRDSIFKLNILEDENGDWLANNKLPIYITSSHEGLDLSSFKPTSVFCLALGNESHGISQKIADQASKTVRIEMSPEIESLNVASAAAILLHKLRQED